MGRKSQIDRGSQPKSDDSSIELSIINPHDQTCPICDRQLGAINVDKHHLVPKTHGGKEKFLIHKICHRKIHATFTEKELEKRYHTWEELRSHEEIQKFVEWVQKKAIDFYAGSDETQSRNAKRRR